MKTIHLTICIFMTIGVFCQNSPLLNTTEEKIYDSNSSRIREDSIKDTLSSSIINDSVFLSLNDSLPKDDKQSVLKLYKKRGFDEANGKSDFVVAFVSCGLLNIFGIIPSIFSLAIPTQKQIHCKKELKKEKSTISKAAVKNYKKGLKDKRYFASFLGAFGGVSLNIIIILRGIRLT